MPRSRSRERDRRADRRSRSRGERRRSRDRDYKRRDRSTERSTKRDKYDRRPRSYEKSSERDRKRLDSREKRRSTSRSKRQKSNSLDRKSSLSKSQHNSVKPIVIIASMNKKSNKNRNAENESRATKSNNSTDLRESFEISNEFSQEGFEQFSRDHGIDFTKIETDEDRVAVHEKMEDILKEHFTAQGKVYPPPKPEKPVVNNVTGFANDGSFLEQFKKMQEEYKQQQEMEKKRLTIENNLKNLPINKRRGGKILKTGLVAKTIVTPEGTITTNSFSSYYKEVQKYKNSSSCDSDSKTRPLVK